LHSSANLKYEPSECQIYVDKLRQKESVPLVCLKITTTEEFNKKFTFEIGEKQGKFPEIEYHSLSFQQIKKNLQAYSNPKRRSTIRDFNGIVNPWYQLKHCVVIKSGDLRLCKIYHKNNLTPELLAHVR
jgi:hypothetical protein